MLFCFARPTGLDLLRLKDRTNFINHTPKPEIIMKHSPKNTWRFAALAALATSVLVGSAQADMLAPGGLATGEFVLGPTSPGKWGGPAMGTPGGTVTWSLLATGTSTGSEGTGTYKHLSDFMPAGYHAAITAAFAAWSGVANISFVEVADSGHAFNAAGASGDIRIGGENLGGVGGVLAHGYYPPANGTSAAGDIHFDYNDTWKVGFGGAFFDIFQVMAHEIGHAIGLNHTGVPSSLMNPFYTEAFAGPQADDIAGAQFIYGRRTSGVPDSGSTLLLLGIVLMAFAPLRRKAA